MSRYLNPRLTIAQAGPVLEQQCRQRFGGTEFEKLYRTLALQAEEQTADEEAQVLGILSLIGKTTDQTNLFLSIIWLAKKEGRDPQVREMLEIARKTTIQQLLHKARQAVQEK
jgi:hypothetical protein